MAEFTLGSDAEVPLLDRDGCYRSAIGLIGGSKDNPRVTKNGAVQEDNVLAEFNVNPAKTQEEFVTNTLLVLKDLKEIIKPLDLRVDISPTALFADDQLEHYLAKLAGCDPDYDAWELRENVAPTLESTSMRSCGGHIHIAFDRAKDNMMARPELVRILDLVAGVPSIIMDSDVSRRQLYGKAGAHRPKLVSHGDPYDGVEYRTLSNFWLASEGTIAWVFRAVNRALDEYDELLEQANTHKDRILNAINNSDVGAAHSLTQQFDLEVA